MVSRSSPIVESVRRHRRRQVRPHRGTGYAGIGAAETQAQPPPAHVGIGEPVGDDRAAATDPVVVGGIDVAVPGTMGDGAPALDQLGPAQRVVVDAPRVVLRAPGEVEPAGGGIIIQTFEVCGQSIGGLP